MTRATTHTATKVMFAIMIIVQIAIVFYFVTNN